MATLYANLSGEGEVSPLTDFGFSIARVVIVNSGMGHLLGSTAVQRWVDIGWIAVFERISGDPVVPNGDYYSDARFIEFDHHTFDFFQYVADVHGVDGIHYALRPGVVVNLITL
jgi:hypothetical protein